MEELMEGEWFRVVKDDRGAVYVEHKEKDGAVGMTEDGVQTSRRT